jgi:hypothetical protein
VPVSAADPLERFRRLCAALPEVVEVETWGHPTFRVRTKMFATCSSDRHTGRPAFTCKAQPGEQEALVARDPARFHRPAYVGVHGWVGGFLDGRAPWDELEEIVEEAWRMTAPKRLVKAWEAER